MTPPPGAAFAARVLAVAADEGPEHLARAEAWLHDLPSVVEAWRGRWRISPLDPLPGSIHWLGRGRRDDGSGCVLKLAVPGAPQPLAEVAWLRRTAPRVPGALQAPGRAGTGGLRVVRLLEADPLAGAQLLELVEPGLPLAAELVGAAGSSRFAAADDAACEALGRAAVAVRRPAPGVGEGAAQWPGQAVVVARTPDSALGSVRRNLEELFAVASGSDERSRTLPAGLVQVAASQARALLDRADAEGSPDVLLHGDLHHDNLLRSDDRGDPGGGGTGSAAAGWTVIDPHGVVGPPAYELACAVYNPFALGGLVAERAEVRCERLAAASGLPHDDVRGWALVQAVLSAVWLTPTAPAGDRSETVPLEVGHVLAVAERLVG